MIEKSLAFPSRARRNFGEPNGGLYCFHLAKERTDVIETVVPPVLKQPGSLRGHLPVTWVRYVSPTLDFTADPVDDGRVLVLLLRSRKTFPFIKHHGGLFD